ncbi:DinB family protein [Neobacillus mesonae]|uniref:Formate dehydrogenase n=1 Tax=Neobacillus mesonae TaxID=1193713 RepID=A0A3Q9QW16_9BACI|nr:DinB family protein [Neobacillus mesonae]AZU60059.1 formate dehydrogenase [Neobacillus mesonae]
MSELLIKSYETARKFFIKNVEALDESILHVQPEGFNNSIHWHVGHVLTVAEQFVFGFPKKSNNLPANYLELFGNGTKPADWNEDVPSVKDLTAQLKDQIKRIKEIPANSFDHKLPEPFLGQETVGELTSFAVFHEALHLGKIQEMKRVIEIAGSK